MYFIVKPRSQNLLLMLSSESMLFPRGIYGKCQAFTQQRTGDPDRRHMTHEKTMCWRIEGKKSCEEIILSSVGKEYTWKT